MLQHVVSNASLKKPVSLAKELPTVSPANRRPAINTATEAHMAYVGRQKDLHAALGRSDADAARDIAMSLIRMQIAAGDYERLSGRQLNARAVIHAAFGSRDINTAHWRMDGGKIVSFVDAMKRVMRAAR